MQGLALLVAAVGVAVIFWVVFLISGVPGFFPGAVKSGSKKIPVWSTKGDVGPIGGRTMEGGYSPLRHLYDGSHSSDV